ncbi:MAG: DoxX family protein [Chlamydiia bacterium]|nr:DoxX family protein [Chlamydiia bacterium]MCP5509319.1 DoxX family protein [Chlamydiales bacterium]HPE85387.1 DoxX family protein [Chlamydiales bacterium]
MWQRILIVLGRVLLAYIFIIGALDKIINWSMMTEQVSAVFADWKAYSTGIGSLETLFGMLEPISTFLLVVAIALELIGGISVLIGFRPKAGAICLILFLIPTTILFHHFWFLEGEPRQTEMINFMKNCSILGGLMILWAATSLQRKLKTL